MNGAVPVAVGGGSGTVGVSDGFGATVEVGVGDGGSGVGVESGGWWTSTVPSIHPVASGLPLASLDCGLAHRSGYCWTMLALRSMATSHV